VQTASLSQAFSPCGRRCPTGRMRGRAVSTPPRRYRAAPTTAGTALVAPRAALRSIPAMTALPAKPTAPPLIRLAPRREPPSPTRGEGFPTASSRSPIAFRSQAFSPCGRRCPTGRMRSRPVSTPPRRCRATATAAGHRPVTAPQAALRQQFSPAKPTAPTPHPSRATARATFSHKGRRVPDCQFAVPNSVSQSGLLPLWERVPDRADEGSCSQHATLPLQGSPKHRRTTAGRSRATGRMPPIPTMTGTDA
jgi:hypothetical protein